MTTEARSIDLERQRRRYFTTFDQQVKLAHDYRRQALTLCLMLRLQSIHHIFSSRSTRGPGLVPTYYQKVLKIQVPIFMEIYFFNDELIITTCPFNLLGEFTDFVKKNVY